MGAMPIHALVAHAQQALLLCVAVTLPIVDEYPMTCPRRPRGPQLSRGPAPVSTAAAAS